MDFGDGLSSEECGDGLYRPLASYVHRLSEFYLTVYPSRKEELREFPCFEKKNDNTFLFLLNYGGDGAPGIGTAFLVSFLNVVERLLSSKENFMVFGSNCDERSPAVLRYLRQVLLDFKYLESNVFDLKIADNVVKVEYKISELPNKMLCFLASELSNCAFYFTTFFNATLNDCSDLKKKIGSGPKDWKPFSLKDRISNGTKAVKKAEELSKSKLASSTKRTNLTSFIKELKSRQENTPLLGEYIDRAKAEALHLKNNVVKEFFLKLLLIVSFQSDLTLFRQ